MSSADESQVKPREIRFLRRHRPSTTGTQLARDQYASRQQMTAEHRLQQLEVIRPKENIDLLNAKFRILQNPRHARPILPQYRDDYVNTLYDQMGTYVQERAGLYHTAAYEPTALAQAIPELDQRASHLTQTEADFKDERQLDDLLNRAEQNQGRSKPKLFQYKAIGDYQTMRVSWLNFSMYNAKKPSAIVWLRWWEWHGERERID